MRVYVILDDRSSATNPLGEAVETFIRREDAERFIEEVGGDDPELASYLGNEERELEAAQPLQRLGTTDRSWPRSL